MTDYHAFLESVEGAGAAVKVPALLRVWDDRLGDWDAPVAIGKVIAARLRLDPGAVGPVLARVLCHLMPALDDGGMTTSVQPSDDMLRIVATDACESLSDGEVVGAAIALGLGDRTMEHVEIRRVVPRVRELIVVELRSRLAKYGTDRSGRPGPRRP